MRKTEIGFAAGMTALALAAAAHSSPTSIIGNETATYTFDALGRLTGSTIAGGPNSGRLTGTCFDAAGNRIRQDAATSAIPACPTPTPSPTPTPTPTPTNSPPTAVADSISLVCGTSGTVNLLANDSDPEGNTPLVLVSIAYSSGGDATASVASSTSASVTADSVHSTTVFSYVVEDSLGAQSNGTLTVNSVGSSLYCS
ncbi:Ig-like domain-containing protein [Sphingomonas soli]|uniref:Ig-like domain-containing protein n=1 Tax=Sphingomonas soli TaxID=266127 RepID=UPI0008379E7A|nr:Ig-like domain-containing protein [Sphingomonas soli]